MAVDFKIKAERGSVYKFPPEQIIVHPHLNGRHELPDIEWLIDSIVQIGQRVPLEIRSDGGMPTLVFGYSRWRAICEINRRKLTPVPLLCICVYFKGDEQEGFIANIHENHVRNATTPLDDAHNCAMLERWGRTVDQIAAIYHEKPAWVRGRMALVNLAPEAKKAVQEGRLKPTAATAIAKLSSEQQRAAVNGNGHVKPADVIAASGKTARATPKQLREFIETTRDDTTLAPSIRKFCEILLAKMKGESE